MKFYWILFYFLILETFYSIFFGFWPILPHFFKINLNFWNFNINFEFLNFLKKKILNFWLPENVSKTSFLPNFPLNLNPSQLLTRPFEIHLRLPSIYQQLRLLLLRKSCIHKKYINIPLNLHENAITLEKSLHLTPFRDSHHFHWFPTRSLPPLCRRLWFYFTSLSPDFFISFEAALNLIFGSS